MLRTPLRPAKLSRDRFVPLPIKSLAQQAARVVHRTHELLSRQRVSLINAIWGHVAEFGVIAAAGPQNVGPLIERISHPATPLPDMVRGALSILADQLVALSFKQADKQINALEAQSSDTRYEDFPPKSTVFGLFCAQARHLVEKFWPSSSNSG